MRLSASIAITLLLVVALPIGAANGAQKGKIGIPAPLASEHAALHDTLVRAIGAGGKTGEAAQKLADVLHPHFVKEEAYALPQLGLLRTLAEGGTIAEAETAIKTSEKLKAEMARMLEEHAAIVRKETKVKARRMRMRARRAGLVPFRPCAERCVCPPGSRRARTRGRRSSRALRPCRDRRGRRSGR